VHFVDDMDKSKDIKQWEEVSLLVNQELAESVAGVLGEIIPRGVIIEQVHKPAFPHELVMELGPVRIYGYLPMDEKLAERRDRIEKALYYLGKISPLPDPTFVTINDENWAVAWQKHYCPIPLGTKLIVVPSWLENPEPDRIPVFMDPGMAFGSGTHPSTQLALFLLESCLSERIPPEMIDIGCGSGILSIAGVKLGISFVLGVDTDSDAVQISKRNAEINQVHDQTAFRKGSATEILNNKFDLSQASIVTVNIIAPVLKRLFDEGLEGIVQPGGNLILSGILDNQLVEMHNLLMNEGFELNEQSKQGEWVALLGTKKKE
jgi:ribosomal protein L11 methyltransferase